MIWLQLFLVYLKIGILGFGGGYAMLSLIQADVVDRYRWISLQEFTDIVAISQMTPGPIGINSATYIGYVAPINAIEGAGPLWGILGSIICTLVVVLPSFLLVRYAGHFIRRHRESEAIEGIFRGLRPVVIGLIASAALILMNGENFGYTGSDITVSVIIAAVALAVNLFTKIHPILIICAAGLAGFILF